MNEADPFVNNRILRDLVEGSELTLAELLGRFNARQARPLAMRTLKSYLANPGAKTRVRCPDNVLEHMRNVALRIEKKAFSK